MWIKLKAKTGELGKDFSTIFTIEDLQVENVTHQAEEIAKAISMQREKTKEMVLATEEIKKIADETVRLSGEMGNSIKGLEEVTKTLIAEVERFKV